MNLLVDDYKDSMCGLELAISNTIYDAKGVVGAVQSDVNNLIGIQIGVVNCNGNILGAQVGLANISDWETGGIQAGGFNVSSKLVGAQVGFSNYIYNDKCREYMRGVQIGIVNVCPEDSVGLQVGVLNCRHENPWYSRCIPLIAVRTARKRKVEMTVPSEVQQ